MKLQSVPRLGLLLLALGAMPLWAQTAAAPAPAPKAAYDEALAKSLGADDYGNRRYVFVLLKTGPTPLPAGAERDEMFRGHFANMKRLAAEGKLVLAGPYDGVEGWRGLFILAVASIDEARALVATDPVVAKGEMVAEYHRYYGTAGLMLIRDLHDKLAKKSF